MRSMTGYGQAQEDNGRHTVSVTLRGVNGRYLDVVLRLREEYRAFEGDLRELVTARLDRGRVEVGVEIRPLEPDVRVEVRQEAARALRRAFAELAEEGVVEGGLAPGDLMRLPAVVEVRPAELAWDEEADGALLARVAGAALGEMIEAREREGRQLVQILGERIGALEELARELRSLQDDVRREMADNLRARIEELLGRVPVDETRLAQEIAVLTDRSDVREELDRLEAHLESFREILGGPGPAGKRLDFQAQELFRELNTLGSKCRSSEVVQKVLDAKVIVEQIREQVQNLE